MADATLIFCDGGCSMQVDREGGRSSGLPESHFIMAKDTCPVAFLASAAGVTPEAAGRSLKYRNC